METKDNLIGVNEMDREYIAECAKIDRVSEFQWACRVAADVARRICYLKQQADERQRRR
jgi:hypothetical protein